MPKKVKSFTIDEEPYEALFKMFKENYVDVSISYFLNKTIKELLAYLESIQQEVKRSELKVPMSYIIETAVRGTLFKVLDEQPSGGTESPLQQEARRLQKEYDIHIGKNPKEADNYDVSKIDKDVPLSVIVKAAVDSAIKDLFRKGGLTDDEVVENFRRIGGKGAQKKIREDVVPLLNKIDPPVGELAKKILRGKKKEDKQEK